MFLPPPWMGEGKGEGGYRVEFTLNGKAARMDVDPHETLLAALRNRLGLLAAKEGCGQGDCGACTILYDGGPANACLILAGQAAGHRIETVEGLGARERLHPIQEAFVRHGAIHCGFCTPGLLISAEALVDRRCTGYTKIVQAVLDAARLLRTRGGDTIGAER
jgi:aerobic-type carbon monoxide dehydrogenase small subunit (CoxS/CutS family)